MLCKLSRKFSIFNICILIMCLTSCNINNSEEEHSWYYSLLGYKYTEKHEANRVIKIGVVDSGLDSAFYSFFDETNIIYNNTFVGDDIYNEHGSQLVSLICGNNYEIGLNTSLEIVIENVYDVNGNCSSENLASAIDDCVKQGVSVINLSLGSCTIYNSIIDSINIALEKDIFVVAAIGDEEGSSSLFPSSMDNVFGIGAGSADGVLYEKSNTIEGTNNYMFPGVDIRVPYVTKNGEVSILHRSGSSYATAIASATIGTLLSYEDLSFNDVNKAFSDENNYENYYFNLSNYFDI